VDVEGGVSLSVLADLTCPCFLRARAVSLRASSSVLVGLEPFVGELELSDMESVDGSIFPINDHLLLGAEAEESIVSFGGEFSVVPILETLASEWRLFAKSWAVPDWEGIMPSKPKKRFGDGECSSLRMMRRRRPGAGWQGAVEGGEVWPVSAAFLKSRYCAQLDFRRVYAVEKIFLARVSNNGRTGL